MQVHAVARAAPTALNVPLETLQIKCAIFREALLAWRLTLEQVRPAVVGAALSASVMRLRRLDYIAFVGDVPVPQRPSLTPIFWEPGCIHAERDALALELRRRLEARSCQLSDQRHNIADIDEVIATELSRFAANGPDGQAEHRDGAGAHGGLSSDADVVTIDLAALPPLPPVALAATGTARLPDVCCGNPRAEIPSDSGFGQGAPRQAAVSQLVASASPDCQEAEVASVSPSDNQQEQHRRAAASQVMTSISTAGSQQDTQHQAGAAQRYLQPSTVLMMSNAKFIERYPRFERWLRRRQRSAILEGRADFWCGRRPPVNPTA
jgi:hypothetical protein